MSTARPTPLDIMLERCIERRTHRVAVEARCPKCRQDHWVCYLKGMREISPGYYRVMCENCLLLTMLTPRQCINDLDGQLFLPLGLKAEDFSTPPVP